MNIQSSTSLTKDSVDLITSSNKNDDFKSYLLGKNDSISLNINDLPDINLPFGSSIIDEYIFPKKFGHVFSDEQHEIQIPEEKYKKAQRNNYSFYKTSNGIKIEDNNFIGNNFSVYEPIDVRIKDSILDNIYAIGKIKYQDYYLILKKTKNSILFSNFEVVYITSLNKSLEKIDELKIYSTISNMGLRDIELFCLNTDNVITKKCFYDAEGEINFVSERKYRISSTGKFIRHYENNGDYENNDEKGLVKNFTRDGKWIERKMSKFYTVASGDCIVESYYKDGQAIGTWNYYMIDSKSNDKPITEIQKGDLLYTESYENGEMVKREFIKNN